MDIPQNPKIFSDTASEIISVYYTRPKGFVVDVEVAGCYVRVNDSIVLLQYSAIKAHKGQWGIPSGRLEAQESPAEGAKRELFEETGIVISCADLQKVATLYIQKPQVSYIYHLFEVRLETKPPVTLSSEHTAYQWLCPQELQHLPLIAGAREALMAYESFLFHKAAQRDCKR